MLLGSPSMDEDLNDLLLQAAGRNVTPGKKKQMPSQSKWRHQGSYSADSDSNDDEPDPRSSKGAKRKPSQVPLKKRHQPDKKRKWPDDDNGGRYSDDDSDSAPSVGSDLFRDEDDKEQLAKMSELERELILAERSTKIDDYKLKQMARTSSSKVEKSRRDSSPPPPSRARASSRNDKPSVKSALNELRAKRMRQQDPEGYRKRLKEFAEHGISGVTRDASPNKHRAGSPPSDMSGGRMDSSDDDKNSADKMDDEMSPSGLNQIKFEDVKDITIRRSKLVKWFMEPFFEKLITGCFVRLGIGKSRSGLPKYRLCIVRSIDSSDPDKSYKFDQYTTHKYLNVVWGTEASAARWEMVRVSDSAPLEEEFKEWLQEVERSNSNIISSQEVMDKKDEIRETMKSYVYSAETVKQMIQEKKSASRRPVNIAAEKDRLRKELEVAMSRKDDREAEKIRARLKELEDMSSRTMTINEKALKLAEMNRKNRAENFKNASEMKPVNTGLKAGEAGYDPFSRRWTRSRNYYVSKPGEDGADAAANGNHANHGAANGDAKGLASGEAATAAALQAAAGAGKLIDTNAPVDRGTELNSLHDFEIPISLAALQQYSKDPAGLKKALMARKQMVEATMGYKVPDNDGRRHMLTLTVSDYKRRRGLL